MKKKFFAIATLSAFTFSLLFISSCTQSSQTEEEVVETTTDEAPAEEEEEKTIASPRMQAEGETAGSKVVVDYGSPAVKGREIWGGLEKYGAVWRAGANETTSVEFSSDVMVGGTKVSAGKYGFFIIPNEEGPWVAILNTKIGWGTGDYDEANDVARVEVEPTWADDVQERLQYNVSESSIDFAWEKARLSIPVEKAE